MIFLREVGDADSGPMAQSSQVSIINRYYSILYTKKIYINVIPTFKSFTHIQLVHTYTHYHNENRIGHVSITMCSSLVDWIAH